MSNATSLLSKLRYGEMNSSAARRLLSLYYREGRSYRVPLGPLRGLRLHYDSSVNFHVMLGLWELKSYALLSRLIRKADVLGPGSVVADVGANLGYFSLWMARKLEGSSRIFAFEPSPSVLGLLEKNLLLNSNESIEVARQACSDRVGKVQFFIGNHHHQSSLDAGWASEGKYDSRSVTVETTTLDAFFDATTGRPPPDLIKIDIEGGGVLAFKGMDCCLRRKRALLWIESHTPAEDRAISDLVLRHDYGAFRLQDRKEIAKPDAVHPDPQGIWGTLLLYPKEQREKLLPALL
jgi:FkbM family methyltransferase